jgi:quercetin dioxygenase-like cupin family protein
MIAMSRSSLLPSDQPMALALAEAMQTSPSGIVSRALLQTAELRVVLFTFADGQELTTHTSTRRALIQILDGACEFEYAGRWERLDAGRLLHLPPGHPHAVRAAYGPFSMLLTLGSQPVEIKNTDIASS